MPVIIKTGPVSIDEAGYVTVVEAPFKKAQVEVGDTAYLWVCESSGGEGLTMRGRIRAVDPTTSRDQRVMLSDLHTRPTRRLGKEAISALRDSPSAEPDATLAKALYRHSHRKIADLTPSEAAYLDGFFDEAPDDPSGMIGRP